VAKLSDNRFGRDRNSTKQNSKKAEIEQWPMPNQMVEADDVEKTPHYEGQQERDDGKDHQRRNKYAVNVEFSDQAFASTFCAAAA
jgi:hypothetical protein